MKKIIFALLLPFMLHAQSQFKNETITSYPTLFDLTYDDVAANRIYARSSNNHIVVSKDNGNTWDVLYSHIHYINSLQLLPGEHTLAFSTEEQLFLYNTQTNMVSLEIPAPPQDFDEFGLVPRAVHNYSFYDANGTTILANYYYYFEGQLQYQKTYYTTDSGATWNMIYFNQEHDEVFITNVAVAPYNPQKIFLARGMGSLGTNGGLWVSDNAGQSWNEYLAGQPLNSIAFNPQDTSEMLVASGLTSTEFTQAVYKSADAGATWVNLNIVWSDTTINSNIQKIVYHPTIADKIAIVEANELATSADGGTSWQIQAYGENATDYLLPITGDYNPNGSELIISTNYTPIMTSDSGATFTKIHAPYLNTTGISLDSSAANPVLYYDALFGFVSKDLNQSISAPHNLSEFIFYFTRMRAIADPLVPGRLFIFTPFDDFSLTNGKLEVSYDYGATKTQILDDFFISLDDIVTHPSDTNIVYTSIDGTLHRLDFSNPENVTSTSITLPVTETAKAPVVFLTEGNADKITIAKPEGIFNTEDQGATWSPVAAEGLNLGINSITDIARGTSDTNFMLAGTTGGIFRSQDAGATWTVALAGMVTGKIFISPFNDAVAVATDLRFATTTLYITTDAGENWLTIAPEQLMYFACNGVDIAFTENAITAYFATNDIGVYSYSIDNDILGITTPHKGDGKRVIVYPNPVKDIFNVQPANQNSSVSNVVLYTVNGLKVLDTDTAVVNISGLSKGLYLVVVTTDDGRTEITKIIKE